VTSRFSYRQRHAANQKPILIGGLFLLGCIILLIAAWCGSTDNVHGIFWYSLGTIGVLIALISPLFVIEM
jgi:cytochrome c oxidase assembly factor CtaG